MAGQVSPKVVVGLQSELGPYAYSGQYQQAPVPRKGGIFSLDYWQDYDVPEKGPNKGKFPDMEFVLVSVDTSFTEKEENDPNGCTTWGIFRDQDDMPKVMLLWAWRKHLPIHGPTQAPRRITETKEAYAERCKPHWGRAEFPLPDVAEITAVGGIAASMLPGLSRSPLSEDFLGDQGYDGVPFISPLQLAKRSSSFAVL